MAARWGSPGTWRRTTAVLAAGIAAPVLVSVLVAGCGDGVGAKPGDPPSSASPTPGAPSVDCSDVGRLPGCVTFTSVSGSDPSGPLAWLGTDPISFSVRTVDGVVTVGIGTPCNHGGGPASLDGKTLTMDMTQFAVTAMGCSGPRGGYGQWAWDLIEEPVSYSFGTPDGTTLTWSNARGTVVFRRGAPAA